jgi:TolB protein
MTRSLISAAFVFLISMSFAADSPRMLGFERGGAVWVAKPDGTGAKKIATGSDPEISPDGTRIAFTHSAGKDGPERHIATADIATGKVTVFKDQIPSDNCYRAIWSPDGTLLLFNIYTGDDWHLGIVNADGTGFRYFRKTVTKGNSLYSACWAPDGRSLYMQDLSKILQIGADGAELKSWTLEAFIPKGSFSSAAHFAVSPDGRTLLMDVEMDEIVKRKDWDGPPPAVWMMDLASRKVTRLTPKGFFAWEGCWFSAEEIVFASQADGEKEPSLHRMTLPGKERKLLIKKANSPSVSR